MNSHLELSDNQFEKLFENGTLKPELFTHEAHLRLAWIHIQQYGIETALDTVCYQLLAYVDRLGARDKYNQTLTVAAVRAVYHFIRKSRSTTFVDFIAEFPRLKFQFKDLMNCHYSVDIFNSVVARQTYVEPDLLPFD